MGQGEQGVENGPNLSSPWLDIQAVGLQLKQKINATNLDQGLCRRGMLCKPQQEIQGFRTVFIAFVEPFKKVGK